MTALTFIPSSERKTFFELEHCLGGDLLVVVDGCFSTFSVFKNGEGGSILQFIHRKTVLNSCGERDVGVWHCLHRSLKEPGLRRTLFRHRASGAPLATHFNRCHLPILYLFKRRWRAGWWWKCWLELGRWSTHKALNRIK